MSTAANTQEWARFEAMLDAMRTGDVTTVRAIVDKTGIGAESAELVLEALVRADLFEQHGDQFLRVSVFRGAELH
jgi:DNA-binding IclR family transcriptional regulator